jgi:hypothetical protein
LTFSHCIEGISALISGSIRDKLAAFEMVHHNLRNQALSYSMHVLAVEDAMCRLRRMW